MAEFCVACAKELGFPETDFRGLTSQADWDKGLAAIALCEGCGVIQVDPRGNCVSPGCLRDGQPGHGGKKLKLAHKKRKKGKK
jgi:hypothetical protein